MFGFGKQKPVDYSEQGAVPWLKEKNAGEFYRKYCTFMKDSYHALLKIVEDLSAREFIQENESMMSEQKFYERIANITREARMSVLRDVIAGHGILMKESEARAAEFMEEHSIEEVKTAKGLGEYFAKMSFDTIVKRKFK